MEVCVIGAGSAGREAAREASSLGAKVTLIDGLEKRHQDWGSWPDAIRPRHQGDRERRDPPIPPEVTYLPDTVVTSVSRECVVLTRDRRLNAQGIVLATGSGFEAPSFEGRNKSGVWVLDSLVKYARLGEDASHMTLPIVAGEGARGLQVAERLAGDGRKVSLLVSSWEWGEPGPPAMAVVAEAAASSGVAISFGSPCRALGVRRVEAVLAGKTVLPADALVIVPLRTPRTVPCPSTASPEGGVTVGLDTRTSVHGIWAAGGCAVTADGYPSGMALGEESRLSGRIAGAGSAGSRAVLPPFRQRVLSVFGLTIVRAGLNLREARALGLDAREVQERWGARSSCSIVFERKGGSVLGLETVTDQAGFGRVFETVGGGATLRSLAYGRSAGSSDISLISETARLGLRSWSGS